MSTATLSASQIKAPVFEVSATPTRAAEMGGDTKMQDNGMPRKRLFSAREYMWLAEIGVFENQKVELIAGEIIIMPPISEPHAQSVDKSVKKLNRTLDDQLVTRNQNPFFAGENERPEPDIAVVRPEALDPNRPPSEALLIIEVSRSTLEYDRTTKLSLYASIGISDYWIINLNNGTIEVYRQPIENKEMQFGHDYASRQIYQRGQSVALLEVPEVSIEVDAMLP